MKENQKDLSPTAKKWVKIAIQILIAIASALLGDAADVSSFVLNSL